MEYNVKQVAEKVGMSVHNVRYYTNMNLVPALKHDKNGSRIFDETAANYLICIRFLRNSGMSIAEIRHYFELCEQGIDTFSERYKILQKLQEQSDEELQQAIWRNKCIHAKLDECKLILEGKKEDDCNPLNWD